MSRKQPRICTCGHRPPLHRLGCLNAPTGATFERWRILLPDQRAAVIAALAREEKRLMGCARRARAKAVDGVLGRFRRDAAVRHASRAGACRIVREILEAVGGHA